MIVPLGFSATIPKWLGRQVQITASQPTSPLGLVTVHCFPQTISNARHALTMKPPFIVVDNGYAVLWRGSVSGRRGAMMPDGRDVVRAAWAGQRRLGCAHADRSFSGRAG
jgi:hypothetical protein